MWICGHNDEFVNINTGHLIEKSPAGETQTAIIYKINHREIILCIGNDEQIDDFLERLFTGTTVLNWR